jgi:hypothetical protein
MTGVAAVEVAAAAEREADSGTVTIGRSVIVVGIVVPVIVPVVPATVSHAVAPPTAAVGHLSTAVA